MRKLIFMAVLLMPATVDANDVADAIDRQTDAIEWMDLNMTFREMNRGYRPKPLSYYDYSHPNCGFRPYYYHYYYQPMYMSPRSYGGYMRYFAW